MGAIDDSFSFLLLYPHEATIENIYRYWERVYFVDIGEDDVIPEGISKHVNATKYLIAGGVAGVALHTVTAPLDRLEVILQVQTIHASLGFAIQNIGKEGGLLGLFQGNGINVLKVAPESDIKFYTYEMLKGAIEDANGDVEMVGRLAAVSGVLQGKENAQVKANKGIGLEVCEPLTTQGTMVLLTARDE
ncbi:UNVERIFIED_CONTAM: Calcium-dependent mitochondrial ATP-magnesium/phosphate carrier protein 2 [Sesamum latifolium]|uniref:Calcium-dependent mitochondrial ATP-magnesium/phosphate carrier protein 2 n=1 Tax=Sesamum latifolium TaxID=2727402 RepID=A0AAW2TMA3_9LAMI